MSKHKTAVPPIYPQKKHTKQIQMYAYIFRKFYGLNVIGWTLLYTARDNASLFIPTGNYMSAKDWAAAKELFEGQSRQSQNLTRTLKDDNIERLLSRKLCANNDDYLKNVKSQYSSCLYSAVCFSNVEKLRTTLKSHNCKVVDRRTTKSRKTR
jgi:hypothetical protein